jgi:hypothetical protein
VQLGDPREYVAGGDRPASHRLRRYAPRRCPLARHPVAWIDHGSPSSGGSEGRKNVLRPLQAHSGGPRRVCKIPPKSSACSPNSTPKLARTYNRVAADLSGLSPDAPCASGAARTRSRRALRARAARDPLPDHAGQPLRRPSEMAPSCRSRGGPWNAQRSPAGGLAERMPALSDQIGLSLGGVVRGLGGRTIPFATSTAHPR